MIFTDIFQMNVILRNPTDEEIIEAIEDNMFNYRRWYSKRIEGLEIIENDEYYLFNSGLQFGFANFALNIRITERIEQKIQKICSYFKNQNLPFHILVTPNSKPENIEKLLFSQGLILRFQEPGMACNLSKITDESVKPRNIDVVFVSDERRKKDWNKIRKIVFDFPKELEEDSFFFHVDDFDGRAYVAYSDDAPVAAAVSYYGSGVVGIYSVVTLPEFRRQGIGKYMTLLLLEDAKNDGYETAILQASSMGKRIYEKLGFKEYCNMKYYTWRLDEII